MSRLSFFLAGGLLATATAVASLNTAVLADPSDSIIPDANALTHEHVPNAVFLRFHEATPQVAREDVLGEIRGTVTETYWLVPGLVRVDTDMSVADALATLGERGDALQYVEPIYIVHTLETTPNDPMYNQLYGMEQIRAPLAWDEHTGDQDFTIAIIDTGFNYNHQDLTANAWSNPGEIAGNGQDDDGNGYVDDIHGYDFINNDNDPNDDNGHGSHCGGTIGGVGNNGIGVAGVNWHCRLAGVKFLSAGGSGSLDDAVSAMQYVAATGLKVSNNSWGGGGFSQAMFDAIQNAGDDYGHIFCAAAGNGGSYGASYPGAYTCSNIICVGASDSNENMASFTQYHPVEVDIAAPGVDVVSTVLGNGYDSYSGTSMATPHVAGGTALIYSVMGDSTSAEIKDIILSTARPVSAWQGNCVTGGILNVADALDATFLGPKFELVSTVPDEMDPNTPLQVMATLDPREDVVIPGSVTLHHRNAMSGWSTVTMDGDGTGAWSASVPGYGCDDSSGFYLTCQGQAAGEVALPSGGASNAFSWTIGHVVVAYEDNGQSNGAWAVSTDATDGGWNRGVPVNCDRGDPPADYDGSGACWLTDNSSSDSCNSDVDSGSTQLTSGVIDLSAVQSPQLSYARWFNNSYGAAPYTDTFDVQISADGGAWQMLESVGPNGADVDGGWVQANWDLESIVPNASTIQLRFTASDIGADTQSVVEAGVDAISVSARECDDQPMCPGDVNGDMLVDVEDLLAAIAGYGDDYSVEDILEILANFGATC